MELKYDERADAASVVVRGPIPRGGVAFTRELDQDRNVRYDTHDRVIEYEFHHVRRHGVKLDDLEYRDALRALFRAAGFSERDWSTTNPDRTSRGGASQDGGDRRAVEGAAGQPRGRMSPIR